MNPSNSPDPTPEEQNPSSEGESFAELLSQFEQEHHAEQAGSQVHQGTVIAVSADGIFVDIGRKREGVLPLDTFRDDSGNVAIKAGDTVTVNITGRGADGYYRLSTVKVERPKDWSGLEKAFAERRAIGGVVSAVIKGGLSVDVGVRAFMPASRSGVKDSAEMEKLVGQEIQCRIIQLDTAKEDVVVDRRVVLEEEEAASRERAFSELEEGAVVSGTVRSLTDFGAFVDLGGIDGLLHVTDLAWSRVDKPADVLSVGDSVEVKILKINPGTRRVSLGRKQLIPDPWSAAAEKYKTGDRVRGMVVRVTDFGAFVELEPGVDGLIHVSEMSWSKKARKPSDIVKPGEAVEVVVLGVNPVDRRIALGLKQALGDPWEDIDRRFPAGSVVEGPVSNLTKFGAFVEIGDGLEGMIHISDITREKRLNHPREALAAGQRVRAAVVEIDRERRRIRLSMKQLEPTSIDEYIAEHQSGDVVTGRFVEVGETSAKVELGEGVTASCRIKPEDTSHEEAAAAAAGPDLSALTAMLSAKWKRGASPRSGVRREPASSGQIRSFRIMSLDPGQKKIELELAG